MLCRYIGFLGLFLGPLMSIYAQYDKVWAFGSNAGIDFNTDPPRAIVTGIGAGEGCASVCNTRGELLFYTNGYTVWNREHKPMPRGQNLPATTGGYFTSSSQGTLIAALPDEPDRYYIFSLGSFENGYYFGRLYYSVVDMALDNGLGDVVAEEKGILLDSMLTEHMSGVSGDDCGLWLVVLSRAKDEVKSFRIDHKGISRKPVISERIRGGGALNGGIGCMDIATNRRRIAVAQGNLVVYDFDPATGILNRPVIVDDFPLGVSPGGYYGVAFSPDNTKLYANDVPFFYQFDLAAGNTADIRNSKLKLSETRFRNAAIKRAPDGKLYTATMSVIHEPDRAGRACRFEDRGLQLADGTSSGWGLPNSNALLHYEQRYTLRYDTFNCVEEALLHPTQTGLRDYVWDDGSTDTVRLIRESGTYRVKYYDFSSGCIRYTDSFHVVLRRNRYYSTRIQKEGLCWQDTLLLQTGMDLPVTYQWDDGVSGRERYVYQPGLYVLQYRDDTACALYVDSFIVKYPTEPYRVSFTVDTFVCSDAPVTFRNTSHALFHDFHWSMGNGAISAERQPGYRYTDTGSYTVQLVGYLNASCSDTAYRQIIVDPREQVSFILSRDSICQGESIDVQPGKRNVTMMEMYWQWGDGSAEYRMPEKEIVHAYEPAGRFPVTLTTSFRACPDTIYQRWLQVSALPVVDLGADGGLCPGDKVLNLHNRHETTSAGQRYLWNTGDTTSFIQVRQPGTYRLTVVANPSGCRATEAIIVHKDCYLDIPNAFHPDGDGYNDYFFPRQRLGSGISGLHMQVLNRYGQVIFETHSPEGAGWDGKYLGKEQPQGTYIYIIKLMLASGSTEYYRGNVTLIR